MDYFEKNQQEDVWRKEKTKGKKPPLMQNCRAVEDFITQKQVLLIQVKKGVLGKEEFLQEAGKHIDQYYHFPATKRKRLFKII